MINLRGNEIAIQFAYDPALVDVVRAIPDRKWDATQRIWTVPATSWHCREVIDALDGKLQIGEDVKHLARSDQKDWNHSKLDLSVGKLRPYPYQAGAVEFLDRIGGRGIIGDDIGLGKTIEALTYARFIGVTRFLVVCPASVLYKWERETKAWYPEIADRVQIIASGATQIGGTVHVISYDMMRRRYHDLQTVGYQLGIFDEFHKLRNYQTLQFKAAKSLVPHLPKIVGLSGTPVFNRPRELFNMLNLLDERAWSWYSFFHTYCGWNKKGDSVDGAQNLPQLEERLRGIMLRRFKREVANQLPTFTRTVVPLQLSGEVMATYRRLEAEDPTTIRKLIPGSDGYFANHLAWFSALRQFLEQARAQHVLNWAEDFLESSTSKLVIYCGYKATVRYLAERLERWGVAEITGDVPNKERQNVIDRWQNTLGERVILLTSAGGEGIDLFGKGRIDCSTLLFAGREWSPATEEQIEGRLDRTGQQYPVEAVYLVCQGTVDEDIDRLITGKREVIRGAVRAADVETSVVPDLVAVLARRGVVKKVGR